jgi:hypothetical protein
MFFFLDKKGVTRDRKHGQDERENNQTQISHFFCIHEKKNLIPWCFQLLKNSPKREFQLKFFGVHMYRQRIWDSGDVHDVLVVQLVTA